MEPQKILSYYPSYSILDEIVSYGNGKYKNLNIFIDLKNALQALYMKDTIQNIIDLSNIPYNIDDKEDTSIFVSIVSFIAFHKMYSLKRDLNLNMYFFMESGESTYHTQIDKYYKFRRKLSNIHGLSKNDRHTFFRVLRSNLSLVNSACNYMPNIHVFYLENMEADFIPYYLIKRKLVNLENTANIIYSNDHDLYQCLDDDVYIFSKVYKNKKILRKGQAIKQYLKADNVDDNYLPLIMAILGDPGDDVKGVDGIGKKIVIDVIEDVVKMVGGMEKLYENLENIQNKKIFLNPIPPEKIENKYLKKIIENEDLIIKNLKLVSFEVISRNFESPKNSIMNKRQLYIKNILENKIKSNLEKMRGSLNKAKIFLQENELEYIFYNGDK